MESQPPTALVMPAFLHGSFSAVQHKTREEGHRCAEQYRKDGTFPAARELQEVPPGEVVVAHEVADFQRERPAWRLYMVGGVADGLCEALDWKNSAGLSGLYEAFCRETAWGALYFAISHEAPVSAERTAQRLSAVLRFWNSLLSNRYRFKALDEELSLEELMSSACNWAMEAWCPVGESSVRARLEAAAQRMARATKEDCLEAILRGIPLALSHAQGLKHRDVLADPMFLRRRLAALEPESFKRVSGAWPAMLIRQLHIWDRQLGVQ